MKAKQMRIGEAMSNLAQAIKDRKHSLLDDLLTEYPELIHDATPSCEVPLVLAIIEWDPKLVAICMRHGASSNELHQCSKDDRPKDPILIAATEFGKKIRNPKEKNPERHFKIYEMILKEMHDHKPFKKSGS